jgi:uncharacterized protein YbgA (DUF1722 family)
VYQINIKEASIIATNLLNKKVTTSNISYLIQYGIVDTVSKNNTIYLHKEQFYNYFNREKLKEQEYKSRFGDEINWTLSFENYKESERTKHVHRLHPYKGKFIPQLVEYFLDSHTDNFKKEIYFKKGDIILDPFCGSGTTLIQSNEIGIHSIGVDISPFNAFISNTKLSKIDIKLLENELSKINKKLDEFIKNENNIFFEKKLLNILNEFNKKYFPTPDFRKKVRNREIDDKIYGKEKEKLFLPIYKELINKYNIQISSNSKKNFLDKWYIPPIKKEINFVFNEIKKIENRDVKNVITLILSRTIRSCRSTTHSDLATLKEPQITPYYCKKHVKICKPLFTIKNWFNRYSKDTIKRLREFDSLRTDVFNKCLVGDSRNIDIFEKITDENFKKVLQKQKIKGIFSSPPYVGLINYHEQHEYAYELFGFKRNDELEIGPLFKGKGQKAKEEYIEGVSQVLINSKKYLADDFDIFLVANDKFNLYPIIAKKVGLKIVNEFKRPVLNRVEKNRNSYSETIFHMKGI